MRVLFINLSVLLIVANSAFAAEIKAEKIETDAAVKKPEEDKATVGELQALGKFEDMDDDLDGDEVKRKKKSATTTFCVEIRPSGEDQRPFQVCEPASDPSKGGYPGQGQGYYQSQTFGGGGQEQLKPHAAPYQSQVALGGQGKPAAAFTSSVKTFGVPTAGAAGKPYASHGSYGGYRSSDDEERMLRTSPDSGEDETSLEDTHARSAYDGYSSGYGSPPSYIPGSQKKHHLHSVHHGQNGLVITCQPSLAGYGHPPILHHGGAVPVPNYNSYRSSDGRYGRPYQPYRAQPQPYGSYQHQGSYKPAYQSQLKPGVKPHAPYQQYKPAAYPPSTAPVYSQPAAPAYPQPAAPAYPQPAAPAYPQPGAQAYPPAAVYSQQPYKAQPAYSQQSQAYNGPEYKSQAYAPAPAAEYKQEAYSDYKPGYAPAAAPEYKPQGYPPSTAEYVPAKPAVHNPSYAPVPAAVYVPPGTYRAAETKEEKPLSTKEDDYAPVEKESHTLRKMEEIAEQRAAGGPWGAEMESEGSKKEKSAMPGPWRHAEGAEDDKGFESARENEVDEQNM